MLKWTVHIYLFFKCKINISTISRWVKNSFNRVLDQPVQVSAITGVVQDDKKDTGEGGGGGGVRGLFTFMHPSRAGLANAASSRKVVHAVLT